MAQTPLYTTQSTTTIAETVREEYEGPITIFTPQDTPAQMLLPVRPVRNIEWTWNVDEIATPTAVVAHNENLSFASMLAAADPLSRQVRIGNRVQTVYQPVTVGDQVRHLDEAGVEDQLGYQAAKTMLGMAKQVDFNLHWSSWVLQNMGATPGQTAGLMQWLVETGVARNNQADATIAGKTVPWQYGSTFFENAPGSPMTENEFLDLVQAYWRNGGDIGASVLFCGGRVKALISQNGVVYTQGSETVEPINMRTEPSESARRTVTIDVYRTDFGPAYVALNRYLDNDSFSATFDQPGTETNITVQAHQAILGIDPRYVSIRSLRDYEMNPVGKTGDTSDLYMVNTCGLQVDNPIALYGASGVLG